MRFSLILGTVERTDELELSLAALDAQTHKDFELIVVDQNPDERLAPILAPYKDRFPLIHLRTTERGLSRAKNMGLKRGARSSASPTTTASILPTSSKEWMIFRRASRDLGPVRAFDRRDRTRQQPALRQGVRLRGPFQRMEARDGLQYFPARGERAGRPVRRGTRAGAEWWAADEIDFLLRVMGRGLPSTTTPDTSPSTPSPYPSTIWKPGAEPTIMAAGWAAYSRSIATRSRSGRGCSLIPSRARCSLWREGIFLRGALPWNWPPSTAGGRARMALPRWPASFNLARSLRQTAPPSQPG